MLTSNDIFNRFYRIHVIKKNSIDSIKIEKLRVAFNVTKNTTIDSNNSIIKIYNLGYSLRFFEQKNLKVKLYAGYDPTNSGALEAGQIFVGDIKHVDTQKNGGDKITIIKSGDGHATLRNAVFAKTYAKMTPVMNIINDLVSSFEISSKSISVISNQISKRGKAFFGKSKDVLKSLLDSLDMEYSIQDENLIITNKGKGLPTSGYNLSSKSGLIGLPSRIENGKVEVTSLLNDYFSPKKHFYIDSSTISGTYVAEKVIHSGDTHGKQWTSKIIGTPT